MDENNSQFKLGDDGELIDALSVEKPKKKGIVPLWWRITQGQGVGILTGIFGAMVALSCLGGLLVVTGAINFEPLLCQLRANCQQSVQRTPLPIGIIASATPFPTFDATFPSPFPTSTIQPTSTARSTSTPTRLPSDPEILTPTIDSRPTCVPSLSEAFEAISDRIQGTATSGEDTGGVDIMVIDLGKESSADCVKGTTGNSFKDAIGVGFKDIEPEWSPDGSRIVFNSTRSGGNQLFLKDPKTGTVQRLTFDGTLNASASWSPDGKRLVFQSMPGSHLGIYVMNADGSNRQPIVQNTDENMQPVWSPDGSRIAFMSGFADIASINIANGTSDKPNNPVNHTSSPSLWESHPVFSPDGKWLVFYAATPENGSLRIMNADGSNLRDLVADLGTGIPSVAWSPDSKQIAYVGGTPNNPDIYVVNVDGTNVQKLTDNILREYNLSWSKDGLIAFDTQFSPRSDIFIMGSDGSNVRNLTNSAEEEYLPLWSPKGTQLAYIVVTGNDHVLTVMNVD